MKKHNPFEKLIDVWGGEARYYWYVDGNAIVIIPKGEFWVLYPWAVGEGDMYTLEEINEILAPLGLEFDPY